MGRDGDRVGVLTRCGPARSVVPFLLGDIVEFLAFLMRFRSSRIHADFDSEVPGHCYRNITTFSSYDKHGSTFPWIQGRRNGFGRCSTMVGDITIFLNSTRSMSTQEKAPAQARQMGAMKVSTISPGIIYEPYGPREPISFLRRWFTRSGWRRTKEDVIIELKNAYAVSKLRKFGYSKRKFYDEAVKLYKEINILVANGDKTSLRKAVTENMYSTLKNEIKQRESMWSSVYWELVEPSVKIRTLRARLIGMDKNDLSKLFVQLTLEFLSKQKFEMYDSKGIVLSGDKSKEVLVKEIWVFEKSLYHQGAFWRLCGRISL